MDRKQFDDLARRAAAFSSRRTIMKVAGGLVVVGTGGAVILFTHGDSDDSGGKGQELAPAATPIAVPPSAPAALALDLASGSPGQTALASLTGFQPGETVVLSVSSPSAGTSAAMVSTTAGADGRATLAFTIPAKSHPGQAVIQAAGQASGASASTSFDIGCASGLVLCADACVDLRTDANDCGACGNACGARDICLDGGCISGQIPKIDAFLATYDGVCVDFDGEYGDQCMDLAEYYNRDVVGAPQIGGDAVDAWVYFSDAHYTEIENGPKNVPQKGDVIVWNSDLGDGSGHIAVCVDADENGFTSFDQNWPTGSCCHYQYHDTYGSVLGWLRPKW